MSWGTRPGGSKRGRVARPRADCRAPRGAARLPAFSLAPRHRRPGPPPFDSSMHRDLTIGLVIPCYNEEDGIRQVIGRMPAAVDEIVVVDNNCTDRTAEVARGLGAKVVAERRRGYGAAYQAGFRAATRDLVVTLDGDGTYPPE